MNCAAPDMEKDTGGAAAAVAADLEDSNKLTQKNKGGEQYARIR